MDSFSRIQFIPAFHVSAGLRNQPFLCLPLSQLTTCLLLYRLFSLTSFIIPLPPLFYVMQGSNFESLSPLRVFLWIFLVRFSHYTGSIQFFLILRPEKREKTKKEGDTEESRGERIGRKKGKRRKSGEFSSHCCFFALSSFLQLCRIFSPFLPSSIFRLFHRISCTFAATATFLLQFILQLIHSF